MPHGFLDRKPVSVSVPSFPVWVVKSINSPKEFKIPVTLISTTCASIMANALIDSGASGNFISDQYIKKHAIKTRKLLSPQHIHTIDGSPSKSSNITSYCILCICVDKQILISKLYITHLGKDKMWSSFLAMDSFTNKGNYFPWCASRWQQWQWQVTVWQWWGGLGFSKPDASSLILYKWQAYIIYRSLPM